MLECDNLYYFGRYFDGGPGKCLCYRLAERHWGASIRAREVTHLELLRKLNKARQEERASLTDPLHITLRAWHDRVEVLSNAPSGEHPLLDQVIDGERRFTVCKQGRCHTNVATLPRQYRQYVRLCGRELTSCDISTSQPLILAILLKNQREQREGAITKQYLVLLLMLL